MNRPPCCPIGHCVCSVHRRHESALSDAGRAVALNPRGAQNFVCQGRSLHDSKMLSEAGAAYLTAMRFGLEGGTRQVGYEGLLSTVRREREYHSRPDGCAGSATSLA